MQTISLKLNTPRLIAYPLADRVQLGDTSATAHRICPISEALAKQGSIAVGSNPYVAVNRYSWQNKKNRYSRVTTAPVQFTSGESRLRNLAKENEELLSLQVLLWLQVRNHLFYTALNATSDCHGANANTLSNLFARHALKEHIVDSRARFLF